MSTKDRATLEPHTTELSRSLSEFDITMIGVGAMIGAGIFVLTGIAAGTTGPSLMLAFALNGVVTIFTAMVYAELGSAIPEAGGGYLWVRDALGRSQSFLAGWMSWFSHAVAGSLYALGFGAFANLLVERAGWGLPHIVGLGPEKYVGVLIAVAFLAINFRGASETGLAGNIVTLAKLIVIGLFIGFGLFSMLREPSTSVEHFEPFIPRGYGQIFVAMGITFIAFEGYEIIVQAGEEVRDPKHSIPRAVFKSLLIVIPIYVLVAITAVGAIDAQGDQATWQFLGEQKELGLALAADAFMPFGTVIILIGGLLSTISALNATTYSSTRVAFAMGRDRVLPDAFGKVHQRFQTPHIALAASGLIIVFMVLAIPIEDVAAAADVMFLLLFLQVNYAVIRIRGEFGDRLDYGYLMPFYPWVPIIGIITKAFLAVYLFNFSPLAWLFAGIWIAVGAGVFVAYARTRVASEDRPQITYERKAGPREEHPVFAAIGNPQTAEPILTIATAVARARGVQVVAMPVVRVSRQIPIRQARQRTDEAQPAIDAIEAFAAEVDDVAINVVVGVGRAISKTIVSIAEREGADLLVIGWRGTVHPGNVRGSVAQEVLRRAPQDVYVVKPPSDVATVEHVLVGVSPGIRSPDAVRAGSALARGTGAPLRLLTVRRPNQAQSGELEAHLEAARQHAIDLGVPPASTETEMLESPSALDAFEEVASPNTAFVTGASRDWMFRRTLLGQFSDAVANRLPGITIVVRPGEARALYWWRQLTDLVRRRSASRERSIGN
ncbi:MAG: amino acid permease [Actinobacteria bacterium]|nr:amino acid permease [Actinomycetota bacterium]